MGCQMTRNVMAGVAGIAALLAVLMFLISPLLAERHLASDVATFAAGGETLDLSDGEIRTRVQQLARKRGFHLEFQNVFVEYEAAGIDVSLAQPRKVGYTLPIGLPIIGIWEWPLVAVRVYPVLSASLGDSQY